MVEQEMPALVAHLRMTLRLLTSSERELRSDALCEMKLGTIMLKAFIAHRHERELAPCEASELLTLVVQLRLALAARGVPQAAPEEVNALAKQLFTSPPAVPSS